MTIWGVLFLERFEEGNRVKSRIVLKSLLRKGFDLLRNSTVAVPGALLGESPASLTDRCHSLRSLYPPPAALPSLPTVSTYADECELLVFGPLLTSVSLLKTMFLTDCDTPACGQAGVFLTCRSNSDLSGCRPINRNLTFRRNYAACAGGWKRLRKNS